MKLKERDCRTSIVSLDLFSNKYQIIKKKMGFVYLMPRNIPIKAQICFLSGLSFFFHD